MSETGFEWPPWIVTVRCALGRLYWVPDDVTVVTSEEGLFMGWRTLRPYEPGVVYRASELAGIAAMRPAFEELRLLHQVKSRFGGAVRVEPRPRRRWTEAELGEAWARWSIPRRERYLALRLRALAALDVAEERATLAQRLDAASWAAERVEAEGGEEVAP